MSEVLIDDSSLNAIAHSIRRKNGLLRTYKPREMAPAIRAFNDFVPDAHSFIVTVQQSPHQTIRVRKYLDADYKEYTNTFTVSEPYYKAEITVEADGGYIAGQPNYVSPITIDRDMVISASPAIEQPQERITTVYGGSVFRSGIHFTYFAELCSDEECTTRAATNSLQGKIRIIEKNDNRISLNFLCCDDSYALNGGIPMVTHIYQNLDTSKIQMFDQRIFCAADALIYLDLSNWDMGEARDISGITSQCGKLETIGNISNWHMPNLNNMNSFMSGTRVTSVDLHNWYTPNLVSCQYIFSGCPRLKVVDISGLTTNVDMTSCYRAFHDCSSLKYIIMDRNEVMFQNCIFDNPNNIVKYLVPSDYVNLYKEHANWRSRASQIDSIDNYTITRYDGQVFVTPNN